MFSTRHFSCQILSEELAQRSSVRAVGVSGMKPQETTRRRIQERGTRYDRFLRSIASGCGEIPATDNATICNHKSQYRENARLEISSCSEYDTTNREQKISRKAFLVDSPVVFDLDDRGDGRRRERRHLMKINRNIYSKDGDCQAALVCTSCKVRRRK